MFLFAKDMCKFVLFAKDMCQFAYDFIILFSLHWNPKSQLTHGSERTRSVALMRH